MNSIQELLIDEMQDLYDAEKQLVKALPKVIRTASSPELAEAVTNHLEETRGHVARLEQAFELLGEKPKNKPCAAMKGLLEEAQEIMLEKMSDPLRDSAMICAAQKVEHYEIAGYGTVKAWAEALGLDDVAELLNETLEEEKAANEKLTGVATGVLADAGSEDEATTKKGAASQTTAAGSRRNAR
jgi:ferritin-like metal-binding protein YciE